MIGCIRIECPYLWACVAQDLSDRRFVGNTKGRSRCVLFNPGYNEYLGVVRSIVPLRQCSVADERVAIEPP